jgi:hypothetical protein
MSFCTLDAVKRKQGEIDTQINKFKFDNCSRTALHAYRILMVPLYFIETGKFELNIFEINKIFNFSQLTNLKNDYNSLSDSFDTSQVGSDLDYLLQLYNQKLVLCTDKPDMTRANQWINNVRSLYQESQK